MKKIKIRKEYGILVITILVFTGLAGFSFTNSDAAHANNLLLDCPNGPLQANLTGTNTDGKTPGGVASYKENNTNGLSVMVAEVSVPDGTNLGVFAGDKSVGEILIAKNGSGELKVDSVTGISEGTVLSIKNGETVILSGTFACAVSSPSPSPTMTMTPTETPTLTPTPTPEE